MIDENSNVVYRKRLSRLYVRVSKAEEEQTRAEAAEMGLTLSDYLRHVLTVYRTLRTRGDI